VHPWLLVDVEISKAAKSRRKHKKKSSSSKREKYVFYLFFSFDARSLLMPRKPESNEPKILDEEDEINAPERSLSIDASSSIKTSGKERFFSPSYYPFLFFSFSSVFSFF
jgi:hypothetical protein